MPAPPRPYLTPEEYLEIERHAEIKSEYYDGEMFAMSGGSPQHSLVGGNVYALLWTQLRSRPCRVFTSDQRVRVEPSGLYTYPDLSVVCGTPRWDPRDKDTLVNPILIVEVLSPTTEAYDRGQKFEQYRQVESLREYLLVSQDRLHIEQYTRLEDGRWVLSDATGPEAAVQLMSIDCRLELAEVYEKVSLE